LTVLGTQLKAYDEAAKNVEELQKSLDNLNHAPFVSDLTHKDATAVFMKLTAEFKEKREIHDRRIYSDDIKDSLEELFADRVGTPFSRDEIEGFIKEGAERYAEKIPPGYEDIKKGGGSELFVDRCKPYGDFFVWLQMLDKAKADKVSIIFITGDVKGDWWSSFQGKTVGPLPALIEEFQVKTGMKFYMYTPHRFLERANEHLKQAVSQIAVDEIKNSERHDESREADWKDWDSARRFMKDFTRGKKQIEQLAAERRDLQSKGRLLKEQHLNFSYHRGEVLKQREMLIPSFDAQQIVALDEEIKALDAKLSNLLSEIEYTRIMLMDCTQRMNEARSEFDGGEDVG